MVGEKKTSSSPLLTTTVLAEDMDVDEEGDAGGDEVLDDPFSDRLIVPRLL